MRLEDILTQTELTEYNEYRNTCINNDVDGCTELEFCDAYYDLDVRDAYDAELEGQ